MRKLKHKIVRSFLNLLVTANFTRGKLINVLEDVKHTEIELRHERLFQSFCLLDHLDFSKICQN
jgi:hypothetical protein